jgi:hypothetical protein
MPCSVKAKGRYLIFCPRFLHGQLEHEVPGETVDVPADRLLKCLDRSAIEVG